MTNQTPFYGEMGGQVGDKGKITGKDLEIGVTDTKKKLDGLYVHIAKIVKGRIKNGDIVLMEVCESNRKAIEANHTVTHLLHHALQEKFGASVTQKGSMVAAERMRFDIAYPKQISENELRDLEDTVNSLIRQNLKVNTKLMSHDEAINSGAMALFGEKYGDEVRVVCVGDGVISRIMRRYPCQRNRRYRLFQHRQRKRGCGRRAPFGMRYRNTRREICSRH
ncbi:MAG: alanine--tRNA ligase-related protein [Alphaproteobacteria bacterium]